MENSIVVKLLNVGKRYGTKQLFQGIGKVIEPGQCLAITGPNGSGKSTLLKMIAGIGRPSTGTICITYGGHEIDRETGRGYMGMVSPEIVFYQAMTGIENIIFLARYCGVACSPSYAQEVCMRVGLHQYSTQFVSTYSIGMKQRLKFAIMLALEPALWLLDEPSSNLDAGGKELVKGMIDTALSKMATVIIATNECWETAYASEQITLG